ncbi:glycine cleavage system aminomethyltransferase GcvT [Methylovirgula sp. 4M-Z18]|uniref:glycine cleavage system aminomethyltransferase GcvT n=1 Tax=Methylovirgula sp. 4M-Z18 TaxID=2293567 RepID=UPI000E2EA8AC|nr:glycine cleavage system aminomethyltransferase GcvT [Methylovirgula sp. 4M-Z18]RFB78868.1 glycine cleavage system aminomethyltransferase GcvT [Methylovirgula sp. 4M-Z18]
MTDPHSSSDTPLKQTPLHDLHVKLGARMAAFAGYDMPIQYPSGILQEHLHTRAQAGLFDVSHMGQAILSGPDAVRGLESLVPGDLAALAPGRIRYTQFLNEDGGILDDLMVTRLADAADGAEQLYLVVNAACKDADFAHIRSRLPHLTLRVLEHHALIALQGPKAAAVLERHLPGVETMPFMSLYIVERDGVSFHVSRSGYTGEDGYEISVPDAHAADFTQTLLREAEVKPIGLGARDSLRLESGLCLYGHDIDTTTTPVEAALMWSISKRRRAEGGFPGDERVRLQLAHGPSRLRVGILPDGKAPAREGCDITTLDGVLIGKITSGGFGPSLNAPVAMGYVEAKYAPVGTPVHVIVRGKPLKASIVKMPFVPQNYYRG